MKKRKTVLLTLGLLSLHPKLALSETYSNHENTKFQYGLYDPGIASSELRSVYMSVGNSEVSDSRIACRRAKAIALAKAQNQCKRFDPNEKSVIWKASPCNHNFMEGAKVEVHFHCTSDTEVQNINFKLWED